MYRRSKHKASINSLSKHFVLTMRDRSSIMSGMNKLDTKKRAQILGMLVEGNSLRATSRLADVSINTVTKLLVDAGCAAAAYHDKYVRNLPCKRIQCDEIWAFNYCKAKTVKEAKAAPEGAGDIWTCAALHALQTAFQRSLRITPMP